MNRSARRIAAILASLPFGSLVIAGCGGNNGLVAQKTVTAADYAGAWTGNWNNQTAGTTGTVTLNVTTNTGNQTVQWTLDLNGSVFGGPDPAAETFQGPFTTSGYSLNGPSAVFGTLNLNIDSHGAITGSGTGFPAVSPVSSVSFSGTSDARSIKLNYAVNLKNGKVFNGTLNLSR